MLSSSQSPSGSDPSPSIPGYSPAQSGTPSTAGSSVQPQPQPQDQRQLLSQKRTRVLFSCAPCRSSKLKCDRAVPACGQCVKKARVDACAYTPRVEKPKPARSMAARLRRLEATVREMVDSGPLPGAPGAPGGVDGVDGVLDPSSQPSQPSLVLPQVQGAAYVPEISPWHQEQGRRVESDHTSFKGRGQVVVGKGATTYVGATHIMAMLDDIEDLKTYFDDEAAVEDESPEPIDGNTPEHVLLATPSTLTKQDLINKVPAKGIVDRLIYRYYGASSPSMHIMHQPTFRKQYNAFWAHPNSVSMAWLSALFMMMALGTFFSTFMAPHELEHDSDVPAIRRFQEYRSAAGAALCASKYTTPGPMTIQAFLLYVEAEFMINRASQTPTYLLMSVLIRLMLKMGMHRDPSKLPNISPFNGEMRRRMWNLAIQLDLMASFHIGLPSMIHGIESDTTVPGNLIDDDLSEEMRELPSPRSVSEYTPLTYPIWKSTICRVFGLVARQSHALSPPSFVEVMKLDLLLEEKWAAVPPFMKIKPLEDSITDNPALINQRFGLSSLYQKSRCVLHRRYLVEAIPKPEHVYSRKTCLSAALALLNYQQITYEATKPGGMLQQNGWFVTSLAIHDFLLAAMIVYLVVQRDDAHETNVDSRYYDTRIAGSDFPPKEELRRILRLSHDIWIAVSQDAPVVRKAADMLGIMLRKIGVRTAVQEERQDAFQNTETLFGPLATTMWLDTGAMHVLSIQDQLDLQAAQQAPTPPLAFSRDDLMPRALPGPEPEPIPQWLANGAEPTAMDWDIFDKDVTGGNGVSPDMVEEWMQQTNNQGFNELDFLTGGFWGPNE